MYTRPLARLIEELQHLPGIGPKTAQRLAFHLLKRPRPEARQLAQAIVEATEQIGVCSRCFNLSAEDPCSLCSQTGRQFEQICVVAEPRDLVAIERTREYKGLYHVLGGLINPMEGIGPEQLRIKELFNRVGTEEIKEVILAINPSVEGEMTTLFLGKNLKVLGARVTRIAFGLPVGGDLEYADEMTLARALEGRREI
ncbi:recombination mediator RecR [Gloeobacter kilaueensis]|uniref:Recombination protein RecR n=1 Tax=Gloeobacter kilaueensis (strain ATCC BAA-2537 / CCAP 1431/1 / ULC 316 / JS1) TaxID=1183438 RepID=U5QF01_GLOK1|nr:recombination mediator RecR [Gloeobacter kilaueensis]AGY57433.1 recombination protein RecR [Gloeobacter kilaueensis JS1]